MKSIKLLFWSAVVYSIILVLVVGVLPAGSTSTIFFTGIPLIVVAVLIARDLSRRSTMPTVIGAQASRYGLKVSPVEFLTGQIKVAASASNSYFEDVVLSRLKELLVMKVALETGLDNDMIRRALSDPIRGPELLHNDELYSILYETVPETGLARIQLVEDAIDMIEDWKG